VSGHGGVNGQGAGRETAPAGSAWNIYDLGYQRYEGARLGRPGAFVALYTDSLRACFGLGRPGRAKIVPVGLTVLALLPAVIAVAVEAIARGVIPDPIRYDNYFSTIVTFLVLFVAAQAPELLGRDQRYRILALYFSRALERLDYPAAKLLALCTALLIVSILPQAAIFLGKVLGGADPVVALSDNAGAVPPILLSSLVAAGVMGALALAVAAFTSRRAYATAGIFALFFISTAVASVVAETARDTSGGSFGMYAPLLAPTSTLEGLTAWLFGTQPTEGVFQAGLQPGPPYLVVAVGLAVAAAGVLAWRYRRIPL
jgi:ABC-2 type transport system permease protein